MSPTLSRPQGNDCHVVVLDGDKLKPREDARAGGNGFGINEEGAGYTLTGVDRHGVAYAADDGVEFFTPGLTPECSPTLKQGTGDHRAAVLVNNKSKEGAEGE